MRAIHCLSVLLILSSSLPSSAEELEGYLGLEIVDNEVYYARRYTPAETAGLQRGDRILAIDAKPVEGLSKEEIDDLCCGAAGRSVTLSVRRGEKEFVITMVTRGEYPQKNVPAGLTAAEYFKLGVKQRELGRPNEARECLQRAIRNDSTGVISKKAEQYLRTRVPNKFVPPEAIALNNRAWNHSRAGRDDEAEELFRESMRICPDFEWPRNNLAGICRDTKRFKEAEELLNHNFAVHPEYLPSWVEMSHVKYAQGDFSAAKLAAARALKLDPDDTSAKEMFDIAVYYEHERKTRASSGGSRAINVNRVKPKQAIK